VFASFQDKRHTIFWLRWLLIIALSYLMLFRTGHLELSWPVMAIIVLHILSNLFLLTLPMQFFERNWVDMALIAGDTLVVSVCMVLTGLSSTYLPFFFFLIILLTTIGKGSQAVWTNGLIMVGVYLAYLLQTQGMKMLQDSGLLIQIPFLIICTVFCGVLVEQVHSKEQLIREEVKSAQAFQKILMAEIEAKEKALKKVEKLLGEMKHQALHDSLTGLPNRTLFTDRLQQAILSAKRGDKKLALIMLDLDRFSEINKTFGHHLGDLFLKDTALRLQRILREADTIARVGGDEFAVILQTSTDVILAIQVAQRILNAMEEPSVVADHRLSIGVSLGIVLFPQDGQDVNTLMRRADETMNKAKSSDSGFLFFNESQQQEAIPDQLVLMGELRHGIEQGELVLHYHPQVDLHTGRTLGVEALVRWQHPTRGLLFPDLFIPLAEHARLMKPLTSWVRNTALGQCAAWRQMGLELSVAFNLSASSLHDPGFAQRMDKMLKIYGVSPLCLELEITESAIMTKPQAAVETITQLSAMGVRIAIDDFGTGYSSLAYLASLPVTSIKIDKSFVMNMLSNEKDEIIVRSTIDLGHNLGLKVIAEGVENREIWDRLVALGCDMGQGYLMSRPIPAPELTAWLYESPWGLGRLKIRPRLTQGRTPERN